eukprot:jgi/Ulvmu1/10565/UM065_0019.1
MVKTPDPGATERKSKPIYGLLNRGDYKAALKQCNQALSKYRGHGLFSILKAFALDRLGNAPEALALAREIANSGTGDEEILHHTSNLLRNHNEFEVLLQMYQKSATANPQDIGLLQEVFLAHVRLGHVLEQQQVAMKISKASPGELQTFWVVCSMLAQVACVRAGSAVSQMQPEMLLKLASALAGKQLAAEGMLSYEAMLVYMDVLQAQGDFDRCMELLEGPCAAAVQMPHELARLKAQTALAAGKSSIAAASLKEALRTAVPDDWAAYMLLFGCCLPRSGWPCEHAVHGLIGVQGGAGHLHDRLSTQQFWLDLEGPESEADVRDAVSDLSAFLASMIELAEAGKFDAQGGLIRGPYLAKVDLAWRQLRLAVAPASMLSSAMLEYFRRYKTKAVAHLDLRQYAQGLPPELRTWLAAALSAERKAVATSNQKPSDWTHDSIRVTLNCLMLEQHLGLPAFTSAPAALEYAHTCMHLYGLWRPLLAGCDKRELGVGEEALELACSALLTAFFISKDRVYIAQAAALLAVAVQQHPHSPGLLLSLSAVHTLLGHGESATATFHEVSPRSVQLDSLCHHVTPALAEMPSPKQKALLRMILMVRSSHESAVAEALADSYVRGTYSKVLEFGEFQRRGRDSMTYLEADTQMALYSLHDAAKGTLANAGAGKVATAAQRLGAEAWMLLDEVQCGESMAGGDAAALWINDDLSQRPAWLAPHACESVLAALEWWEQAQHASGSQRAAAGVRWWQLPQAATSDGSEAAAWRAGRTASLSFVSAQPLLMAHILSTCADCSSARSAAREPEFDATEAMQRLLQAAGVSWLEVCDWHSGLDWSVEHTFLRDEMPRAALNGGAHAKNSSMQQLLRTLTISSLAAGSALHSIAVQACPRSDASDEATPSGTCERAGAASVQHCATITADVLAAVCMRVIAGLRVPSPSTDAQGAPSGGGLLDGVAMHALLVLVHHSLLWLASLTLAAGYGLSAAAAGLDGPQRESCAAGVSAVQSLLSATERVCDGLQEAVRQCVGDLGDGSGVHEAVSSGHRRCLAEAADEDAVAAELKRLGAAQLEALSGAAAGLKPMLAGCQRVAAHLGTS